MYQENGNIDARVGYSDLPPLIIHGRVTHPIIQWGMGVNISNGRLAWNVALAGWIGTLSSVWLAWVPKYKERIFHALIAQAKTSPEIYDAITTDMSREKYRDMIQSRYDEKKQTPPSERNIDGSFRLYQLFHEATFLAAREEIGQARQISGWKWALWLNVMKAIHEYKMHVRLACETGLNGIVSGAWLPLDLPELVKNHSNNWDIALIPILSNLRWVQLVMRKWERYGKFPDAIVLEDPTRAAWHLGAGNLKSFTHEDMWKSTLEVAVPEVVEFLRTKWLNEKVPVIAAGDIVDRNDISRALELWAKWVQLGTRFLASHESGANDAFKSGIVEAQTMDNILLYNSNAMLPARGLKASGVFPRIAWKISQVRACAENCLVQCAYRDGEWTNAEWESFAQMCILEELAMSTDNRFGARWLMFCGVSALKIHSILTVSEIMDQLLKRTI